ncbi:MAG: FtsX-like permease family protein [Ginsengibacter sp.]
MIKNYFKTAFRNLKRHKGYTTINIFGLVFGLAAFWMIALYVADEISYDKFNTNADRIVRLAQHASWDGGNMDVALTSAPFAPSIKANYPEVKDAVRIDAEGGGIVTYNEKKIKAGDIIFADKSLLNIFTYHFLYGDATALNEPGSMVITESLAKKIFGLASHALNQTVYMDANDGIKITGVIKDIPENSHLRFSGVRPLPEGFTEGWQNSHLYTYLLLKKNVEYKNLERKLQSLTDKTIKKEMAVKDYHLELQPLTSIHLHSNLGYEISPNGSISRVYIFIAIGFLILIIAIINYMNLATARSSSRVREVGVRKAIGSGRWHLAKMFLTESLLLTLVAAVIAIFVVNLCLPFFNELSGKQLTIWRFGVVNTLCTLVIFSMLTGILSGVYPSVFLSGFKTIPALKGQMGDMNGNANFRKTLVVFQFVITIVMITGAVIIYRQLQFALHSDLGFNKDQVLTFHIDSKKVRGQLPALKTQLLQSPLIKSAAAAGNPIGNNDLGSYGYEYEKNDGSSSESTKMVEELVTDPDYLNTMEIKLVSGRNFSADMPADKTASVLVNETLVKELGWKNPLGKQMLKASDDNGKTQPATVIGVVKDFHTYSLQHKVEPMVLIMPKEINEQDNLYVKLAKGRIADGLAYLSQVYRQFDNANPIEYNFLDENFARQYVAEKKQGELALVFSGLAIIIACLGLFGLATFTAEQRRKEIGIRKVLGANISDIVQMLSKDFLKLVFIASLIAVPVAWFTMEKWLQDFAYRINIEWWIFVLAGCTALFIALGTISFQAIKAALANPVKSLRAE